MCLREENKSGIISVRQDDNSFSKEDKFLMREKSSKEKLILEEGDFET